MNKKILVSVVMMTAVFSQSINAQEITLDKIYSGYYRGKGIAGTWRTDTVHHRHHHQQHRRRPAGFHAEPARSTRPCRQVRQARPL